MSKTYEYIEDEPIMASEPNVALRYISSPQKIVVSFPTHITLSIKECSLHLIIFMNAQQTTNIIDIHYAQNSKQSVTCPNCDGKLYLYWIYNR